MEVVYLERGIQLFLDEGKTQFIPILIKIRELRNLIDSTL
jgi:hypothetical protein